VEADEAPLTFRRSGRHHLRDRERRGVRGEDRLGLAQLVEPLVGLALEVEVLDDGLDDEVAVGEVFEFGRAAHAAANLPLLLGGDGPLLGELRQRLLYPGEAALAQLARDFADDDFHPGRRAGLRDARAHQAAAEHAHFPYLHTFTVLLSEAVSKLRKVIYRAPPA
jgi:hypothetical protein